MVVSKGEERGHKLGSGDHTILPRSAGSGVSARAQESPTAGSHLPCISRLLW
jgi:hypothetical protein